MGHLGRRATRPDPKVRRVRNRASISSSCPLHLPPAHASFLLFVRQTHWGSDTEGINKTRRYLCESLSFTSVSSLLSHPSSLLHLSDGLVLSFGSSPGTDISPSVFSRPSPARSTSVRLLSRGGTSSRRCSLRQTRGFVATLLYPSLRQI